MTGLKMVLHLVSLAALLMALAALPLSAQKTKKKPKEDSFLSGQPFSFQELVEAVPVIFPGRLTKAVDGRGVNFYPTAAQVKQLKDAGAPDELIALIEMKGDKFKPVVAAPPKPVVSGPITIECAPPECGIQVNGKPEGQTQGGVKKLPGIPLGPQSSVVIDFSKDGYFGQQVVLPLKGGAPASAKPVVLQPTPATEARFGQQVFNALIGKLGGEAGLKDAGLLSASGSANLFQSGGQRTEWSVEARLKAPAGMAYLEINGAGLKWWCSLRGSDTKANGSGKLKGGPVAIEMEKMTHQYRDYQPAALIDRIRAAKMKLTSESPGLDGPGPVALKASSATGTYVFTIGGSGLPERVEYLAASGLGSGMVAVYGDYVNAGQAKVPKAMDIRFGDQAQHGMEFRFDRLQSDPKLADKEFHR